jgi:hypothetical protein
MAQTEFREFLLVLFHRTEFRSFSLPLRIRNVIPGVPSIFVPRNIILSCFLFRGRVLEQNPESFLFRGTAGIPLEIPIRSGYSVFQLIIFLSEIPDPSSEPS